MNFFLLLQFALCPIVLIALLKRPAPYGRHHDASWRIRLPNRLAWLAMELPALVLLPWFVSAGSENPGLTPIAFTLLWCFHYGYRTLVFPFLISPAQRSFPAVLILLALGFHVLNSFNNAGALTGMNGAYGLLLSPHVFLGFAMFAAGFAMHVHSDAVISRLRSPGQSGYAIPQGGLFRWVSNPNYLGEMIEWTGWAIMTWSWAGLAFALFTVCNLLPRAIANQRWYRERFPDYPAGRRVLIPGVF